jgi:hypothetical protein
MWVGRIVFPAELLQIAGTLHPWLQGDQGWGNLRMLGCQEFSATLWHWIHLPITPPNFCWRRSAFQHISHFHFTTSIKYISFLPSFWGSIISQNEGQGTLSRPHRTDWELLHVQWAVEYTRNLKLLFLKFLLIFILPPLVRTMCNKM